MFYTSKTPKIGALIIAFETAEKSATSEQMKSEVKAAFQSTLAYLHPL